MRKYWRVLLAIALTIGLIVTGLPAVYAQDDDDDADVFTLEEIIVTATKREESILEVPLTVTAFDDKMIEELGITTNEDLEQLTPGLQFGDPGEKVGQGTVIRGIGSRLWGESHTDLAVAYYVDGVYSYAPEGITPNLFDVDRVEVARGPQGTLHGRNSIAGSISFFTKRPTAEWDADLLAEFTDAFTQRYNVAFGGPLFSGFRFRFTGGYYQGSGAQENRAGEDLDAPDETYIAPQLRFKNDWMDINLRYTRTENKGRARMQVQLRDPPRDEKFWDNDPTNDPNEYYLWETPVYAIEDCGPNEPPNQCENLKNIVGVNAPSDQDMLRESATLSADFDFFDAFTVRLTGGINNTDSMVVRDSDSSERVGGWEGDLWYTDAGGTLLTDRRLLSKDAGTPFSDQRFRMPFYADQGSAEIQVLSNFDGPFNFIAGAFYYHNETGWYVDVDVFNIPWRFDDAEAAWINARDNLWAWTWVGGLTPDSSCTDWANAMNTQWYWGGASVECATGSDHTWYFRYESTAESETKAAFIHADYEFSDKFIISGGVRYTEDLKKQGANGGWLHFPVGGVPLKYFYSNPKGTASTWDQVIFDVSAEYTPFGNTMFYGRVSSGYRAGGFNTYVDVASLPSPFVDEETLMNYEIGVKSLSADQRLLLTSAAFYATYEGFQINLTQEYPEGVSAPPTAATPLIEYTANVDGTTLWGAEIEVTYHLGDRWRLSGYYNYLDSELGHHVSVTRGDPDAELIDYWHQWFPTDPNYVDQTGEDTMWDDPNTPCAFPGPCRVKSEYVPATDKTGNQLAMQPNHKFSLTASYTMPMPNLTRSNMALGELRFLTTYSYTGSRHPYIANLPSQEMRGYGRWDARIQWTSDSGRWSASLFAQNIMDEIGLVEYIPDSTNGEDPAMGTLTEGRRLGFTLRWKL